MRDDYHPKLTVSHVKRKVELKTTRSYDCICPLVLGALTALWLQSGGVLTPRTTVSHMKRKVCFVRTERQKQTYRFTHETVSSGWYSTAFYHPKLTVSHVKR